MWVGTGLGIGKVQGDMALVNRWSRGDILADVLGIMAGFLLSTVC